MREIRFNIWDKKERVMYPSEFVTSVNLYEGFIELGEETYGEYTELLWDKVLQLDECEMLQYTGLKDKNGVEIYEGDIIKCTDGEDKINELNSDTGIGQVEWFEKFGFWNISNIENGLGDIMQSGYVEIIGNIYENKEMESGK